MRHTTALHLLQAGVGIAVIALRVGHESTETIHGYVEADLDMKQRALEKLTPATATIIRFKAGDSLPQFLSNLGTHPALAGTLHDDSCPPERRQRPLRCDFLSRRGLGGTAAQQTSFQ